MSTIRLKRGLDLPISGAPRLEITEGPSVSTVALVGRDYIDLKPTMSVAEGDTVKAGDTLFVDKRDPTVHYVAPGSGTVTTINRGAKRILQSVVITLGDNDPASTRTRDALDISAIAALSSEAVREALHTSGHWTAFRTRPYSKVPRSDSLPDAVFVNVMDTNPLAPDPAVAVDAASADFLAGLIALSRLGTMPVYVCHDEAFALAQQMDIPSSVDNIRMQAFAGPHPSGLVGTHIHHLHPVNHERTVWSIGYQDVIAIGRLFHAGELSFERIIGLVGPMVNDPRLIRTRLGASTEDLVRDLLAADIEVRVITGSVLSGRRANNWGGYLGRYHNQVSVIPEGRQRELFGWVNPRGNKFSSLRVFLSSLGKPPEQYRFDTSANGSPRAMVPIGAYERVMPLDILPTPLLRALLVRDTDAAQQLGCLELDEEDIALCSYVDNGKYDFGPVLRANLEQIEKDG